MNSLPVLLGSSLILVIVGCAGRGGPDPMAEAMEEGRPGPMAEAMEERRPDPMAEAMEEERIDFSRTTEFDGNVLTVDLSSDDRTLKLNTLRDVIATEEFRPPLPNQSGRSWVLLNTAYDSTSLVYAVVSWDNDDPTDYLAAGWWVHVPRAAPGPRNIERSIFIDGPEIDSMANPPDMPVSGNAHYVGGAGGVVQYEFGSSWGGLAGQYALGEYTATMTVTADFDEGTVAGCLGCIGDIEPERRHIASVYEDVLGVDLPDLLAPVKDYEIHFAAVAYGRDSTFESELVTVAHEERTPATIDGHWGGSFSNVDDAKGNPRLVNGFTDAYFMEPDGSAGILWGIFNALSPALIPEEPPRSGSRTD